jgi:hypothetical protein
MIGSRSGDVGVACADSIYGMPGCPQVLCDSISIHSEQHPFILPNVLVPVI